jgi:hypothetical protein
LKFRVEFDPGAELDLLEASAWYDSQSEGLGAEFWRQVRIQEARLSRAPEVHAVEYADIRRAFLGKFPLHCTFAWKRMIASASWHAFTTAVILGAGQEPDPC